MDVLVVGGGIVGATVTYRLAQRGVKVTLLDKGEASSGTSGASFAWLNAHKKEPRIYHDLNISGVAEHVALADEFDDAPWLHLDGSLAWATTNDDEFAARVDGRDQRLGLATTTDSPDLLRAHAARLQTRGYVMESVDTERVSRDLEPGLKLDPKLVPEVWYSPEEGWADVPRLVHQLLLRARDFGAEIREHEAVVSIDQRCGRVEGLCTADGSRLAADVVVDCAGPSAAEVAALSGARIPLVRVPGLLAVSRKVEPQLRHVCNSTTIAFRPDASGGLVLAHAEDLDRTVTEDTLTSPMPLACQDLFARARPFYPPLARAGLKEARIGVRAVPEDGVTIAGPLPSISNFLVAVTHSGATLGPLIGRLIAEEIDTGAATEQLAAFRPERFPNTEVKNSSAGHFSH